MPKSPQIALPTSLFQEVKFARKKRMNALSGAKIETDA